MILCLMIAMYFLGKQTKTLTTQELIEIQQNENERPLAVPLQPIYVNDHMGYSLQNDELNITYDDGETWVTVPVKKDLLFEGEYNGNKQELIEHSYILTKDIAAFLYTEGPDWDQKQLLLTYSFDQGETWEKTVITENFAALRFRKVDFLNKNFGYVIVSGGRTMSQEYSTVFLTHDGGQTWSEADNSGVTRLIYDGGFVDDKTGFLSFGIINPEEPDFYVTQDGGNSWTKAIFQIPEEFKRIFAATEVPFQEDDYLAVLLNQGPNGDYKGGEVKGKFISRDNGKTWGYQQEVAGNAE